MSLQNNVFELINNNQTRLKLAAALDVSENTIRNYINWKHDNLTKAAALKVIREETGLTDSEILEESKVTA